MKSFAIRRVYLPEERPENPHHFITAVLASLSPGDLENAAEQTATLRHLLNASTMETQDSRNITMPTLPRSSHEEVLAYLRCALQEVIFDRQGTDITYARDRAIPYAEAVTDNPDDCPSHQYDMLSAIFFSGVLQNHTEEPDEQIASRMQQALIHCRNADHESAEKVLEEALIKLGA